MRKDRSERVVKYLPTETALYRPDPLFWQMVLDLSQPACNIQRIFSECFLSVAMFGTSRENLRNILKEKIL